jgi:hypothetical protein
MPPDGRGDARQACDVTAFGQEVGRVLSDGRIVGRAEPFANVFPSSRVVKRAVGLAAWGVLEDIALDARLDEAGRLVAETNVRRIAANLGLNKDMITSHLRTLREHGFVLRVECASTPRGGTRRSATCWTRLRAWSGSRTRRPRSRARLDPCPKTPDTVIADSLLA